MTRWILLSLMTACGGDKSPAEGAVHSSDDTNSVTDDTGEAETLISFEVKGVVIDMEGSPVPDALVMVGGRKDTTVTTAEDGTYSIWFEQKEGDQGALVAGKIGYRSVGATFLKPGEDETIVIRKVNPPDNLEYVYEDPGDGENVKNEDCTHCHQEFVSDFLGSGHARATRNPLLQDLYAGVSAHETEDDCLDAGGAWGVGHDPGTDGAAMSKCYLGGGVLPDLNDTCGGAGQPACDEPELSDELSPDAYGACADCHAPGINGVAGGRDLHDAHGLAFDIGVHCDTCHKVSDVDMSKPPGVGQRLVMSRPSEPGEDVFIWDPVYFGPLLDVPTPIMRGSLQPKFDSAEFCAGCHEQKQEALIPGESLDAGLWPDGLPTHSTYSEWLASPYNTDATPCQHCHMPGDVEAINSVHLSRPGEAGILFGWPRDPEDIRKHTFRGPLSGDERLVDTALYTSVALEQSGDTLEATVSINNIGCGHAIPTGEPMRALILVVESEGSCGSLSPIGGMTINDVGGAMATGSVGFEIDETDDGLLWSEGAAIASVGQVVRVVRPSGVFDDYAGIGDFADPALSAEDKGVEVMTPVGTATVAEVTDDTLLLDGLLPLEVGDQVYLGEARPEEGWVDGAPSRHLAGLAGHTFSRVLVDSSGNRQVPHYKAVDMVSDNRIGPGQAALSSHGFRLPSGCTDVSVTATVLYRPHPLNLAVERAWDAADHVISTASAQVSE